MEDKSLSNFDMYEVGAIADAETFVDAQWRKETRPKRIRPRSEDGAGQRREQLDYRSKGDKRMHMFDGASFDTSSHHTIDYLLENRSAKSFTFGHNARYPHLKR